MDIVITYVNGLDPVWQADYEKYTNKPIMVKRYRDWGTLKYLLRGIEVNMPFIRNVFLVVSHETQVPEWADTENLKVVLHKDIIPAEYLPTFNSTTIEMFLHKIEGLDEEYIYFNDDMFPVDMCEPTDFFRDGKIILGFTRHWFAFDLYKKHCRNSSRLAQKALGQKESLSFLRPQHICSPMLKKECDAVYAAVEDVILKSLSRTRTPENLNQYLFLDYMYFKGKCIPKKMKKKHFSVAIASTQSISDFIKNPSRKLVCINDVKLPGNKFETMRDAIIEAFETRLPHKSRFEK